MHSLGFLEPFCFLFVTASCGVCLTTVPDGFRGNELPGSKFREPVFTPNLLKGSGRIADLPHCT